MYEYRVILRNATVCSLQLFAAALFTVKAARVTAHIDLGTKDLYMGIQVSLCSCAHCIRRFLAKPSELRLELCTVELGHLMTAGD